MPALTGIRIVLSVLIVLNHFAPLLAGLLPPALRPPVMLALTLPGVRVDMFFMLSGLVINHAHRERWTRPSFAAVSVFWQQRLARVYPLHLSTLLLMGAAALGAGALGIDGFDVRHFGWRTLAENLLLAQAWHLQVPLTWNAPAWSLSVEWLAYLTAPFVLVLTWRLRAWAALSLALVLAVVPAVYETLFPLAGASGAELLNTPSLRGVSAFYVGALMAVVLARGLRFQVAGRMALAPAALGLCLLINVLTHFLHLSVLWCVPAAAAALLGLAWGEDRLSAFVQRPLFMYWSRRSFALYMTHYLWLTLVRVLLPTSLVESWPWLLKLLIVVTYLAPLLLFAELAHRLIELPARRWLDRRFEPKIVHSALQMGARQEPPRHSPDPCSTLISASITSQRSARRGPLDGG